MVRPSTTSGRDARVSSTRPPEPKFVASVIRPGVKRVLSARNAPIRDLVAGALLVGGVDELAPVVAGEGGGGRGIDFCLSCLTFGIAATDAKPDADAGAAAVVLVRRSDDADATADAVLREIPAKDAGRRDVEGGPGGESDASASSSFCCDGTRRSVVEDEQAGVCAVDGEARPGVLQVDAAAPSCGLVALDLEKRPVFHCDGGPRFRIQPATEWGGVSFQQNARSVALGGEARPGVLQVDAAARELWPRCP